jgi:hypothetical protein
VGLTRLIVARVCVCVQTLDKSIPRRKLILFTDFGGVEMIPVIDSLPCLVFLLLALGGLGGWKTEKEKQALFRKFYRSFFFLFLCSLSKSSNLGKRHCLTKDIVMLYYTSKFSQLKLLTQQLLYLINCLLYNKNIRTSKQLSLNFFFFNSPRRSFTFPSLNYFICSSYNFSPLTISSSFRRGKCCRFFTARILSGTNPQGRNLPAHCHTLISKFPADLPNGGLSRTEQNRKTLGKEKKKRGKEEERFPKFSF